MRGCTPRRETPSSYSAPNRTGRGRRGRDRAVSHFPLESKTHRHALGTPAGHEPNPAPPPVPRARSPSPERRRGAGKPSARPEAAELTAHSHTPVTLLLSLISSCWPRKSALSQQGWVLTARHRRPPPQNQGTRKQQAPATLSPGTRLTLGASQAQA